MVRLPQLRREHIRARHVVQGRLLHVRIDFSTRNLDLFNIYQQSISFTQSQEHYARRAMLFRELDAALSALPVRNLLILGGDFNLQAFGSPPHVGPHTTLQNGSEQLAKDLPSFMDCLRKHDLCALNTWGGRQPYTYVHLEARTQIDFILDLLRLRRSCQACTSLDGRTLVTFRFEPEFPSDILLGVLQRNVRPSTLGLSRPPSRAMRPRISLRWRLCALPFLFGGLWRLAGRPTEGRRRALPYGQAFAWGLLQFSRMWHHYQWSRGRQRGQCSGATFREIFARWRHLRQFQHMRRLTQQHGRMLKRACLEGYLQQ